MEPIHTTAGEAFVRLATIMDELREQCPWDRKQTIASLRQMTIEETYELADAITAGDWKGIREELGDLLLHIVFYARIGRENGQFTLPEIIHGICDKLVARHPHVYGDPANEGKVVQVQDAEDVKRNWEKLKLKEGKKSVIAGVPRSLPALVKAMRLQEKAKQVGFEWDNKEQVMEKVEEEMAELREAVLSLESGVGSQESGPDSYGDGSLPAGRQVGSRESGALKPDREKLQAAVEEELGDVLFSLINYARFLQVDAENALEVTNKKFIDRFSRMEEQALQTGKKLEEMSLQEMDAIWNSIKQQQAE